MISDHEAFHYASEINDNKCRKWAASDTVLYGNKHYLAAAFLCHRRNYIHLCIRSGTILYADIRYQNFWGKSIVAYDYWSADDMRARILARQLH